MRGTTLALALKQLKAHIGYDLTIGTAEDQALYQLISDKQSQLAALYDWPFLRTRVDANVSARYSNAPAINFERQPTVSVKYGTVWLPVTIGISENDYTSVNPDTTQQNPIEKWDVYGASQIEVWPVPASAQTLRFVGQKPLSTLLNAGAWDPTKTLDLDDQMITLAVAAELLAKEDSRDAQIKASLAERRLRQLTMSGPNPTRNLVLGKRDLSTMEVKRIVPITTVAS